jgi:hypothetical protein
MNDRNSIKEQGEPPIEVKHFFSCLANLVSREFAKLTEKNMRNKNGQRTIDHGPQTPTLDH